MVNGYEAFPARSSWLTSSPCRTFGGAVASLTEAKAMQRVGQGRKEAATIKATSRSRSPLVTWPGRHIVGLGLRGDVVRRLAR